MPVPDKGFVYWGGNQNSITFPVPFPTEAPFEGEWGFDGARNAEYVLRGDFIGRQISKQSMSWALIRCEQWWEINRFLRSVRNIFWCRYFDQHVGEWKTRRFYAGNPKVDPIRLRRDTGEPDTWYRNATLNIIDTGEGS